MATVTFTLFAYGTLLKGEPDHHLLGDSPLLRVASTEANLSLVEFRAMAGMVEGGITSVTGELYDVPYDVLAACDKHRDHPSRYHRKELTLADGSVANAYFLHANQARGLRRIRHGDWRARFRRR